MLLVTTELLCNYTVYSCEYLNTRKLYIMKKIISGLVAIVLATSVLVSTAQAKSKYPNRGTVVSITATIEYPDGTTKVHNMDTCTPGGFYNGIDAIIFGDESIKIYQAGYSALHPEYGDIVNKQWYKKANADDPWLPTYLLAKNANTGFDAKNVEKFNSSSSVFMPQAKTSGNKKTIDESLPPMLMSACGGHVHPPN